jgi:hypothetical protein
MVKDILKRPIYLEASVGKARIMKDNKGFIKDLLPDGSYSKEYVSNLTVGNDDLFYFLQAGKEITEKEYNA